MPPRKRKAQQALAAIEEEPKPASSLPQQKQDEDGVMADAKDQTATQIEHVVQQCKEQVESKAEELILAARQRVQSLRADAEAAISKLSKQVRQMSAVNFFKLTPAEAQARVLLNALSRLQALQQESENPGSADAMRQVATSLAAVSTGAAPTGTAPQPGAGADSTAPSASKQHGEQDQKAQAQVAIQQPAEQQVADQQPTVSQQAAAEKQPSTDQQPPTDQQAMKTTTQHQQASQQQRSAVLQEQEQSAAANGQASTASACKSALPMTLMPPPPPRLPLAAANHPSRAPIANEVVYSANGSPIHIGASFAPGTMVKGVAPSLTDATPAMGVGPSSAVAPPTMAFTGRTFRRAAPTRGRTKQPTRAITVTTQDGKQFTVDDLIGMAGVPQAYRDEVRRLVEADLQDLTALVQSVATLEQSNTNAQAAPLAPVTTSSRPTRRR